MRVSVIMPAYNVEPFIGDALRSALAQTVTDLEVVVVDDGSTDGTAAVVEEIARRDDRVRFLQQANRGLAGARNTALAAARGDVLALLDSDDLWEPAFLAEQLAILDARPGVDIVTGNGRYLGGPADGQPARPYPDARPAPDLASIIEDERAVFIMSVFRRRVYDAIGGFDQTMRTNEDYDFWLRAANAGFRFARNDRPLCLYRIRGDSLSANEVKMLRGILYVYGKLRPALTARPDALALVDGQIARFEAELLTAEARDALAAGEFHVAQERLNTLRARRGGATLGLACFLARWSPRSLMRLLQLKRVYAVR
jgi:glycosyltransferase involved in cell wall biosynthesis